MRLIGMKIKHISMKIILIFSDFFIYIVKNTTTTMTVMTNTMITISYNNILDMTQVGY